MKTYLAEVTSVEMVTGSPVTRVWRFATFGYNTTTADTPAHTHWEERIIAPAAIRRDLFQEGRTSGRSRIGYGILKLANADGALDSILMAQAFVGHPVKIWVGDAEKPFSTFGAPLFGGICDAVEIELDTVNLRLRDNLSTFDRVLQPNRFGGTNVPPAGVDGTPTDLKGKPKPLIYGVPFNIEPKLVNAPKLIYQVKEGSYSSVIVFDEGIQLTSGLVYTSIADMEANAPASNAYGTLPGTGHFRLGAPPSGVVTADVVASATSALNSPAEVFKAIAQLAFPTISFVAADLTALQAAAPYEIGLYLDEDVSALEALDQVAASAGAWYTFDPAGTQIRIAQLQPPSGTPVVELSDIDIVEISLVPSGDNARGVPAAKVALRYGRNHTVQTTVAAATTAARRARVSEEWLRAEATGGASLVQYPTAPIIERESLISNAAHAATEVQRLLDIYKVRRDMFRVVARGVPTTLSLNAVIRVVFPRFGLASGKLFLVLGIQHEPVIDSVQLILWG